MFLPTRLASTYEEVSKDDVTNSLSENIAILVAMLQDKFAAMGEESGAEQWAKAAKAHGALQAAVARGDAAELVAASDQLGEILKTGGGVQQREREILDIMARHAHIVKAETYRREKSAHSISPQELMANQALIISVLKEEVEPSALARIARKLGLAAHAKYG